MTKVEAKEKIKKFIFSDLWSSWVININFFYLFLFLHFNLKLSIFFSIIVVVILSLRGMLVRKFMLAAYTLGMTNGDWVFLDVEIFQVLLISFFLKSLKSKISFIFYNPNYCRVLIGAITIGKWAMLWIVMHARLMRLYFVFHCCNPPIRNIRVLLIKCASWLKHIIILSAMARKCVLCYRKLFYFLYLSRFIFVSLPIAIFNLCRLISSLAPFTMASTYSAWRLMKLSPKAVIFAMAWL